ncbi:PREDICTED: peptidyl-tRNA hydrolase ICT1, mitochondrial-like [Amphimedon queenslandica]|uniref:Large ribosomal subunit protein mL62 n=1 Tax=Amphimedon queenslandica TaxID=400682 RepID=A0A1X7UWY6_AMPQE|nr:PREDICTED: peptidyl-tRNA hydrolase ICT1, mitochondrial-like [Amphimedon queenslandica]|eukprot:XP_003386495.1 PREDICTED: peptidyl-tRNA hydrolase ICT1, mitochondrial-like [Amphimedon queenslandica]
MSAYLFRRISLDKGLLFCRIFEGHLMSCSGLSRIRLYCDKKGNEDKPKVFKKPVPRDKLDIRFSRSSGPGGQNVNKLSTKAEVRFNVQEADWLPDRVKERLKEMFGTKINKLGEIIVTSQVYRTQYQNLEDAIKKLTKILEEASELPNEPSEAKLARIRKLKRQGNARRLSEKKYNSFLKNQKKLY